MSEPRRKRILLLIPHLGGGGAEHVMAAVAAGLATGLDSRLDAARFEVHLAVLADDGDGAPQLPEQVQVHRLEAGRVRRAGPKLVRLVRAVQPELVVSGMMHLSLLVLALRPWFPAGTAVGIRVNTTLSLAYPGGWARWAQALLLRRADAVLCQSEAMAEDAVRHMGIRRERCRVVPNPVAVERMGQAVQAEHGRMGASGMGASGDGRNRNDRSGMRVLCVGRLAREKGVDLLLEAWQRLPVKDGDELVIVGEGRERAALEALSRRLGVESTVRFAGYVAETVPELAAADVYVQPSRLEGMPNALLEAAAAGLPLVATPCSAGVVELLRNADGAWVAEATHADALAAALRQAMDAVRARRAAGMGDVRLEYGFLRAHGFLRPFTQEAALQAWSDCLLEMAGERRR